MRRSDQGRSIKSEWATHQKVPQVRLLRSRPGRYVFFGDLERGVNRTPETVPRHGPNGLLSKANGYALYIPGLDMPGLATP